MFRSQEHKNSSLLLISAWALSLVAVVAPIYGACNSAPIAVDDFLSVDAEPTLLDALANDSELEGQALTLSILSTDCPGTVVVDHGLILIDPGGPLTAECTISYQAIDEDGEFATGTILVSSSYIFADGFESGSVSAWSVCEPVC